jgi:hypothetical protein
MTPAQANTAVAQKQLPKAATNPQQLTGVGQVSHEAWPYGVIDRTINEPVALFTLALVVSTVLLWRATLRLAREARESANVQAEKMERSIAAANLAASHAQTSAAAAQDALKHAKTVSNTELRPWVAVSVEPQSIKRIGEQNHFQNTIVFQNVGRTVAKSFIARIQLEFNKEIVKLDHDLPKHVWAQWSLPEEEGKYVIMPGERFIHSFWSRYAVNEICWHNVATTKKYMQPVIIVSAFYKSDMDDVWHRTDCAFVIGLKTPTDIQEYVYESQLIDAGSHLDEDRLVSRRFIGNLAT